LDLLDAAGLIENEQVAISDVDNGARVEDYVVAGDRGSGVVGHDGTAALLVRPGVLSYISAFRTFETSEIAEHRPRVVHVDGENRIVATGTDGAEPVPGMPDQISGRASQGLH